MKKILIAASISAMFIAASYSAISVAEQAKPKSKPLAPIGRVVPVVSGQVTEHQLTEHISLIGKLAANRSVEIAAEVAGKISEIHVDANEAIQAGQVLVILDDAKSRASVSEAQAYLNDEQRKLNEYQKLKNSDAITQSEIEAQKASVDMAKARLQAAQAELAFHQVRAPFAGTAGLVDFSLGKMVSVGSELLTLDDLSSMRLDVPVPEMYLSRLYIGMDVTAKSRAWQDESFTGKVVAIDPRINTDTLNLRVRVNFDNPNNKLMPGMMMSADIGFAPIVEPVIPVQALEYSGTKRFVYVIDDKSVARRTQVTLGARIGDEVLISSGVNVGDKIVVQGLVNMRDGLRVEDLAENQAGEPKVADNNELVLQASQEGDRS
ncbi:efflux RND transporter periplasmic adaptor subunit [Shewanella sp. AS1]|uniref:efflux RND transporter periplasmic adaptor subunit n=1 Tax=Shewanella sp. AS1 TaxID=2907626 RepID=UPI001F4515FE|nr:efflux RND transporter periplasmic adaptor subunit [Shewanella sp. AS1]MCE9678060.1 efflux RND transporter periplasmic adaptor subunit [Shewanella sp. AS1]